MGVGVDVDVDVDVSAVVVVLVVFVGMRIEEGKNSFCVKCTGWVPSTFCFQSATPVCTSNGSRAYT